MGLLKLIEAETVGIDVGFWFMEDIRYSRALVKKWCEGVPIRVILDERAFTSYGYTTARAPAENLRYTHVTTVRPTDQKCPARGPIPMRKKVGTRGIFHFKTMIFAGQGVVEFSGANYSDEAFVPRTAYQNYVDEVIIFSDEGSIVNSFKSKFDDVWTDMSTGNGQEFAPYGDFAGPYVRVYGPAGPIDPELSFGPSESFANRSLNRYKIETQGIDSVMYRITDQRHTNAMIAAVARGVPVRLISEPDQYRSEGKQWHSWNIDRMYMAGVQIRHRLHAGQSHEKLTILHRSSAAGNLPMTILGSSNWTSASDYNAQHEHNWFTTKSWVYNWSVDHFNRKWNNTGPVAETTPFVPLPPNTPLNRKPANNATGQPTSVTLEWYAGFWAHKYDVYLGTSASNMVPVLSDTELGPSTSATHNIKLVVPNLQPGTTYFWKVTGRTMANLERTGGTWSFTTAGGTTPPTCGALPSGWASTDIGGVAAAGSACYSGSTFTVTGSGADVWGTADEFRFTYRSMTGDGSITARVATIQNIDPWTKSGVMMREALTPGAAHAAMFVSPGKGLAFQRRAATGASTTSTGATGGAPKFVRITRAGNLFTAAWSDNGTAWTTVAGQTIAMPGTIYVGIPMTSHRDGTLANATVDNVTVGAGGPTEPPPTCGALPSGWAASGIGAVAAAGTACYNGSAFTVEGSGADSGAPPTSSTSSTGS